MFLSTESKKFKTTTLPTQAQYAPVSEIITSDFNQDGNKDILLLGNDDNYKLRIGKFDANYRTLLMGNTNGTYNYIPQTRSGLSITGSNTHAVLIGNQLILINYGAPTKTYILDAN